MQEQHKDDSSQSAMPMYHRVDVKYITQLRIEIAARCALILTVTLILTVIASPPWHIAGIALTGIMVIALLLLHSIWAPRRYQLTGYLACPEDVRYRTGALWRKHTAIPLNRIQHVEITQGGIERMLGLAKLIIYTAGGHGSDLAIPGLPFAHAEKLRDGLLASVVAVKPDAQTEHDNA